MTEFANRARLFPQVKSVIEMHSRKSQAFREKSSKMFREAQTAILFSSDVSARGVDYPDVSLVLQVGMPANREQYIHRLGRTGRAGKSGRGVLLIREFEEPWARKALRDLPIEEAAPFTPSPATQDVIRKWDATIALVSRDNNLQDSAQRAYSAWLGYYKDAGKHVKLDRAEIVQMANQHAKYVLGYPGIPPIPKKTVGKMGLKGIPGLNIVSQVG